MLWSLYMFYYLWSLYMVFYMGFLWSLYVFCFLWILGGFLWFNGLYMCSFIIWALYMVYYLSMGYICGLLFLSMVLCLAYVVVSGGG